MHQCPQYSSGPQYQPGLIHVFGGLVGLTTAALQGGARLIRTVVEGAVWEGGGCYHPHMAHGGCCEPRHEHGCGCRVECVPPMYTGCCCR